MMRKTKNSNGRIFCLIVFLFAFNEIIAQNGTMAQKLCIELVNKKNSKNLLLNFVNESDSTIEIFWSPSMPYMLSKNSVKLDIYLRLDSVTQNLKIVNNNFFPDENIEIFKIKPNDHLELVVDMKLFIEDGSILSIFDNSQTSLVAVYRCEEFELISNVIKW